MKTLMLKTGAKAILFALVLISSSTYIYAQDALLSETEDVLNSEQIDVDGQFQTRPKVTPADRIAAARKNLEKQNEDLVRKKIEDIRIKEEQRMTKRLRNAFKNGIGNLNGQQDQVSVTQAAPQKVVAAPPKVEEKKKQNEIKVIPNVGVLNIKGEDIDFESNVNAGLSIESMVSKRISFGIGFNYATMDLTDINSQQYYYGYDYNMYNQYAFYNQTYYNTYGYQGRELQYQKMMVEIISKFFLATEARIKPYIGLGVGYNRTNLEYKDQGAAQVTYQAYNVMYGEEEYNSSYVSGSAMAGAEVSFTDNFGMNLELKYTRGLTSGFNTSVADQNVYNIDQVRLNKIGHAIENAHFGSITAGLVVSF